MISMISMISNMLVWSFLSSVKKRCDDKGGCVLSATSISFWKAELFYSRKMITDKR